LSAGAGLAGDVYTRTQSVVAALDAGSGEAATEAGAVGAQGRSGSGVIRDQARAQAAAIAPMANSAAGMRLMVSTMDQHVAAMQQQVDTTHAQNQALTTRLRQVAATYRGEGAGQIQAVDYTQDRPQPTPGPQPFLPAYEQALTAPPPAGSAPSGRSVPFSPPPSPTVPAPPPAPPSGPPWSAACQSAADAQEHERIMKIFRDMGKGAVLGGLAGVTVDGVGALPGLISGAAIGGIGGVIDWATSPNPLPPECK
jgi:hypothetical protein